MGHKAQLEVLTHLDVLKRLDATPEELDRFKGTLEKRTWSYMTELADRLKNDPLFLQEHRSASMKLGIINWIAASDLEESMHPRAIETVLSTLLLNTWTAFEVLAVDLWVASVNFPGSDLAQLNGTPKRIAKLSGLTLRLLEDEDENEDDGNSEIAMDSDAGKCLSLNEINKITGGTFNLTGKMGRLLRRRFKFTSLKGIRKAYSAAFSEKSKRGRTSTIDKALSSQELDALALVRNVIVHSAGVADQVYEQDCKRVPIAPQLKENEKLVLNGELCRRLIDPVVVVCKNMIDAADSWLKLSGAHSV